MAAVSKERESRILALVQGALEQAENTRDQWIVSHCGDDEELSDRVVTLVKEALNTRQLLATGGALQAGEHPEIRRIDDYEILNTIGEGGMAVVYLATRAVGLQDQKVAIKVSRVFGDVESATRRFKSERELLASLNHPYIAQLLDWGTTAEGDLFQVMEWIDGLPIDTFVSQQGYNVEQIVRLLLEVCTAVEAAHRNLIIHRDLKPSNILVTEDGIPKLIDFGIAKQVDTELTTPDQLAFTPAFASPEQIRGEVLTTSTDVYSLGVVAYLLLTGHRPYDLTNLGWHEAQQKISVTKVRAPENLPADLGLILETALQSDSEHRYGTVQALAADLENYLGDRPISVKTESTAYRVLKFVKRNAALTASVISVSLALTIALAVSIWQTQRAEVQLARAETVTQFLRDLIIANSPGAGASYQLSSDVTLAEILDLAEARLVADESAPWDVRADLLSSVAHSLMWMEEPERAIRTQLASLKLVRSGVADQGGDKNLLIRSLALTGEAYENIGDFDNAIDHYAQADAMARSVGVNVDENWLYSLNNYGFTLMRANRWEEAESVLLRAWQEVDEVWLDTQHPGRATLELNLAAVELELQKIGAARARLDRATYVKDIHETPYLVHKWWRAHARTLEAEGNLAQASSAFEEAARIPNLVYSFADVEQTLDRVNAVRVRLLNGYDSEQAFEDLDAITQPYKEVLHLPEAWPVDFAVSVAHAQLNQPDESRAAAQLALDKARAAFAPMSDQRRIAALLQ